MIDIDALGVEGQCKANIIEQLKAFPHWTPGRLKGELVCVKIDFTDTHSRKLAEMNDRQTKCFCNGGGCLS